MSSSYQPWQTNYHDSQDEFDKATSDFDSAVKWAVAGSIISGLVITIAIVAVIYAVIDCLKKTGTSIPSYARLAISDRVDKLSYSQQEQQQSSEHVSIAMPRVHQVPDRSRSQVEFPTMERFLSNMAREKPIRFSPDQIAGFTEEYSTILGSGGFGVVFKGLLPNGTQVAVKLLTDALDHKSIEGQFMAEVGTMGRTHHINLVRLLGFCFDTSTRALVYEYMEKGSLDRILFDENREVEWQKLNGIAIGTAKGIAYLHEECQERIIHYDIKPANILLDGNLNPKVADFGLAKLCKRDQSSQVQLTGYRGTPGYAAPELWMPHPVTHKCDVYSFGILLFEILGRRRHHDINAVESRQWLPRWTWEMFKNNELVVMLSLCGIEEKDRERAERMSMVALWCVQYSPEARPLMSSVVKMLEGDIEIAQPPNPFERLESNLPIDGGSNDWSTSVTDTESYEQSYLKSNKKCEIELIC